jgi:hypothetical protein
MEFCRTLLTAYIREWLHAENLRLWRKIMCKKLVIPASGLVTIGK